MAPLVHEHLPAIPHTHILGEPMGRSTAAAIGWAAATIAQQDPDAIMASFHADAVITQPEALLQSLHLAYELAEQGYLITLGVKPSTPETGYGYIRFGDQISTGHTHQAFKADRFVEKPNLVTAQSYLEDMHYVWNSGIFIWKVKTFLAELQEHLPATAKKIEQIVTAQGTKQKHALLEELWPTLPPITIDHGIMEKTKNLLVIPVDLGWNDVGNWIQYGSLFSADDQGIRAVGLHTGLDSQNSIIYNNTSCHIFTIGVEDLIIVQIDDVTVICHKDQVQRVKELADQQQKKR